MTTDHTGSDQLEKLINHRLRNLPLQRAPVGLQARVWAGLQQRALPWWRKSFSYWPLAARVTLILLCLVVAEFTIRLVRGMHELPRGAQLTELLGESFDWVERIADWMQALQSFTGLLLRHTPQAWQFGGLVVVGSFYAIFLLFGAATYRTLVAHR